MHFPNEITLKIFPHLPLKGLVVARSVNRQWRLLVTLSDILPARRALLELYIEIVSSPFFPLTRSWPLANLRTFNRQAYLDALLKQHVNLPEAFCLWILEWPARAVISCIWPGLPYKECKGSAADQVERFKGYNWLGHMPPQVSRMEFLDPEELVEDEPKDPDYFPGLLMWSWNNGCTWLVLDERESLRDKVYILRGPIVGEDDGEYDTVYSNFVEWQRDLWKKIEEGARQGRWQKYGPREQYVGGGVGRVLEEIPATPWSRRDREY